MGDIHDLGIFLNTKPIFASHVSSIVSRANRLTVSFTVLVVADRSSVSKFNRNALMYAYFPNARSSFIECGSGSFYKTQIIRNLGG